MGIYNDCVYVSLSTGSSLQQAACWLSGGAYAPSTGWSNMDAMPRFFQDVNGDGLPDIVGLASNCLFVSLNTGSSFQQAACWLGGGAYAPQTGWSDMNTLPRFLEDVNGDGLPDIVGLSNGCTYVSLNTGSSFQQAACWSPNGVVGPYAPQTGWTNMNDMPRYLIDVNGDGLADIVGIASNCTFVSLSSGTGFGWPTCWLGGGAFTSASGAWYGNDTTPRLAGDIVGTGRSGIMGLNSQGIFVAQNGSGQPGPDMLTSITTGLGATTTISYGTLTNKTIYTKDKTATYPQFDLQMPAYVVSRVDRSNGVGGSYSAVYNYAGAKADVTGRGFLGLRQMTVKDIQTGIQDTTTYRQDFPFIGLVNSMTRSLGTQTLGQSINTYRFFNTGGGTAINPWSAPYQVLLSQNVSSGSDLDGSALPTITTSNQYDLVGNATQVVVSTSDGFSKTTASTYANDMSNWYLGRLTRSSVTSVAP